MEITKAHLKQIIREELAEGDEWYDSERGYETVADRKYADQVAWEQGAATPDVLENALVALEEEGHYLARHIRDGVEYMKSQLGVEA